MKKILTLMALLVAFVTTGFAQDQEEVTWTVAGSSSDVFGTTWDTSNTANDMTLDSGTGLWTLTKSDVTLNVGEVYKCKVVKNHSWDVSYPAEDVTFSVGATGVYSVTVTYNPENDIVSIIIPGAPHTYTVAGSSATLFGNTWNPENANNDMAKNNAGLYEWSKSNVSLAAGNIEFKVVAERNWDLAYPNDNYQLNIPSAGNYDVVITFNDETREINATATALITSVQIFGSWNEWDSEDPINLTAGANNSYTGTISYTTATAEEFKLVVNETWLGYDKVALAENYNFVSQGSDNNFKLSEAYLSYDITATWTPSADASAGWTLTIVPGDERPKYTYTATFVNGANWENVYAYIWKVDGDNNVELNGPFPGVQLEKTRTTTINTVEYDVYTFTFETYEDESTVPEMIIFSDGTDTNKTEDLDFEEGKEYTETVPHENYYVIGYNGTEWVALGKMNYFAYMNAYDYTLDKTWTGKYFAIAPASALKADGSVDEWDKVVRPKSDNGNYLVELRQYYDDVVTGGNNVWEKADDFTQISIVYYLDQQQFALYPESEVTISEAGYATYSNKYAYQISGVSDYVEVSIVTAVTTVAVMNNLTLFTEDGDTYKEYNIPAGTGVIVKGSGSFLVLPYGANGYEEYVDVTGNMLIGSGNSTYDITGYDTSVGDYKAYILADRTNGVGFYPLASYTEDNQLAPHKAFLAVRKNQSAPDFIGFGDTTGINNVERGALNVEGCYTLDGRRVENPTKGLYIINGKKVLVK